MVNLTYPSYSSKEVYEVQALRPYKFEINKNNSPQD